MMDTPPAVVIDRDTIRRGAERIRIMNIDAPETEDRAKCNAERRLAALATMTLSKLIVGERLEIERHGNRFGRTLAYMRVSGAEVDEMLIRAQRGGALGRRPPGLVCCSEQREG
jgi:micrococcal nuclease